MSLYTIGHGTRPISEFVSLLQQADIALLIDVRAFPGSRTNPQFAQAPLRESLANAGIAYEHWPALGGRRKGLGAASPNAAWKNAAFRAYADYMMEESFWLAIDELLKRASEQPTAVLCSETLWWRCHRRLIADAAVARGARVLHLITAGKPSEHVLSPVARIVDRRVIYSGKG
jgi:uncharacterized protein (DUF488 family)